MNSFWIMFLYQFIMIKPFIIFFYVLYIALMWKRTKKYITNWAEDCIRSTWKQFSKWIIKAHWWAFMWMKESERKDLAATIGPNSFWGRFRMVFFVTNKFNKFCLFICNWFFFHQNNLIGSKIPEKVRICSFEIACWI